MNIEALFDKLWLGYRAVAPQAPRIHELLSARGESFSNDHVAFRTFDLEGIGLEALAAPFLELGYVETGRYRFVARKLLARSYSHPSGAPRVFISELCCAEFSAAVQADLRQVSAGVRGRGFALLTEAPTWPAPSFDLYQRLSAASEYAGWVAAHGLRANHFTVSINDLVTFTDIDGLNAFLVGQGFALNGEGRCVQGSPAELLEQSSTIAPLVEVAFADGPRQVPGAYYEFAKRYDDEAGVRFDAFISGSADRIFSSTDARGAS